MYEGNLSFSVLKMCLKVRSGLNVVKVKRRNTYEFTVVVVYIDLSCVGIFLRKGIQRSTIRVLDSSS